MTYVFLFHCFCIKEPQWGPWNVWSACSLTGITCSQTRRRICSDPDPNDSINCPGDNDEERECPFGSCGRK